MPLLTELGIFGFSIIYKHAAPPELNHSLCFRL